jgi:hypothetical protein
MKKSAIILALALGVPAWPVIAQDQGGTPPAGDDPAPAQLGSRNGPGGPGGNAGRGFHVLPPWAMQELDLTDAQKKQLTALETEVKAKVEKILTADQLKKMKQLRPPLRQGGPGMGGPGWGGQRWGGPAPRGQGWGGPPPGGPRMGGPGGPGGEGHPPLPAPE